MLPDQIYLPVFTIKPPVRLVSGFDCKAAGNQMGRFGALLAITGLLTGVQVWRMLMSAIWGAPTSSTQYVSLVGSVVLIMYGTVLIIRSRGPIWPAIMGLLLEWVYYCPALLFTLAEIHKSSSGGLHVLVPAILLLLSTAIAIHRLQPVRHPDAASTDSTAQAI